MDAQPQNNNNNNNNRHPIPTQQQPLPSSSSAPPLYLTHSYSSNSTNQLPTQPSSSSSYNNNNSSIQSTSFTRISNEENPTPIDQSSLPPPNNNFYHSNPQRPLPSPSSSNQQQQQQQQQQQPHQQTLQSKNLNPELSPNGNVFINDRLSQDFPEIGKLSKEDLQDLLNDPDYFDSMFIGLRKVKDLMESHQGLITANEALAEKNLNLKPGLESLRDETLRRFNRTKELIEEFDELYKVQSELYSNFGEQSSKSRLLTGLHESEKLSESIGYKFSDELMIEEDLFVRSFMIERVKFHKRNWVGSVWKSGKLNWN